MLRLENITKRENKFDKYYFNFESAHQTLQLVHMIGGVSIES